MLVLSLRVESNKRPEVCVYSCRLLGTLREGLLRRYATGAGNIKSTDKFLLMPISLHSTALFVYTTKRYEFYNVVCNLKTVFRNVILR